ncbi:MAG: HAMP domain-containing sensor histidine kinase, partial [Myxococcota bacterium]
THVVPVPDHGTVTACVPNPHDHGTKVALSLVVAALVLMLLSGVLARRLARPIRRVASVATAIGTGDLSARVTRVRRIGEVGVLADAIDDMAERIETQVRDQKELMAGVSHELRTPLGHVRLLLELARSGDTDALDELEREVEEMDRLVGELLARSRLDFASLDHRSLDPVDLARRALERQGIDVAKLVVDEPIDELVGDPTLLGRALANILSNAERHGGGLITLRVSQDDELVFFVAEDAGPGFQEDAFDPFVRTPSRGRHPSLGLGLVLTRRIAEAHGGNVTVAGNAPRGARVQLAVERHSDLES